MFFKACVVFEGNTVIAEVKEKHEEALKGGKGRGSSGMWEGSGLPSELLGAVIPEKPTPLSGPSLLSVNRPPILFLLIRGMQIEARKPNSART